MEGTSIGVAYLQASNQLKCRYGETETKNEERPALEAGKASRVFISSRLRDMHAQRDVLNRVVFPSYGAAVRRAAPNSSASTCAGA